VTGLMRQLGYGQGYRYAHDEAEHFAAGLAYLPESLVGQQYYVPGRLGFEAEVAERLARLRGSQPAPSPDISSQREPDED
jgi:putative ATPase